MKQFFLSASLAIATATSAGLAPAAIAAETAEEAATVIPAPPPGKGQIVFYRTGGIGGMAMGCAVHENGEKISSLGAGKYFMTVLDPGEYKFMTKSETKKYLKLTVAADETVYSRCKIKMGFMMGRPKLGEASKEDFDKRKLKMVDDDDMGPRARRLDTEGVSEVLEETAANET